MKHKINDSQTRKAELNVHPLDLISKYPCKHFIFHNANRLIPKKVNLDFSNVKFTSFSLKITNHTCLTYAVSFPMTDAKHSTDSETVVQSESQAQENHEL